MTSSLLANPLLQRLFFIVTPLHLTMATCSFVFDQPFMLLVPELVVWFEGGGSCTFPSKPDFVENSLSVCSKFVIIVTLSLRANPLPQRRVFLVLVWHHAMALLSFKLNKLCQKGCKKSKVCGCGIEKKTSVLLLTTQTQLKVSVARNKK
jgi:hypothetical protein